MKSGIEEHDYDLCQLVMFSVPEQKIYVGNRCLLHSFEIQKIESAVAFVKGLLEICTKEIRKDAKIYIDDFKINPKVFNIADNQLKRCLKSILILQELNMESMIPKKQSSWFTYGIKTTLQKCLRFASVMQNSCVIPMHSENSLQSQEFLTNGISGAREENIIQRNLNLTK